jgi:intraflagellar transport protein 140
MYVLAANFLQGSDWIKDTSLMKTITGFYHKAKAFDLLANFFESCSLI